MKKLTEADLQLIRQASDLAHPKLLFLDSKSASVGCALKTASGEIFTGVNIDMPCGIGYCAEHNAIGNMLTSGITHIDTIVAVSYKGYVYPPCGRCREFIFHTDSKNAKTRIIIAENEIKTLDELLPHSWTVHQNLV